LDGPMAEALSRPTSPSVVVLARPPSAEPAQDAPASPQLPACGSLEEAPSGSLNEAQEVTELVALLSMPSQHGVSKRAPLHRREEKKKVTDIGPGWNSTPHRSRPKALRGLNSTTEEPWTRSEVLNYGSDAYIEWRTNHKSLYRSGGVPEHSLVGIESSTSKKSEAMGNRQLNRQARQLAARKRAELAALKAAQRAEEEAWAAELQVMRKAWEAELVRQAQAEDKVLVEAIERQRRLEAAAAAEVAAAEAARVEAEEAAQLSETKKAKERDAEEALRVDRARIAKEKEAAQAAQANKGKAAASKGGVQFESKGKPSPAKKKNADKESFMHRSVASQRASQKGRN